MKIRKSDSDRIEDIAREVLGIKTLKTRGRDSLDFHELSVWKLREVLLAAYEAGNYDQYCELSELEERPTAR